MPTPVELPKFGNTVDECLLSRWVKRSGDRVSAGDVIAEIETDKTTFELTAPVGGTLLETFVDEGALAPVFTNLCVIGDPGESVEAFRPGATTAGGDAGPTETATGRDAGPTQSATSGDAGSTEIEPHPADAASIAATSAPLSPRAARFAREHDLRPASVTGSGPGGRVLERDLRRELAAASPRSDAGSPARRPAPPETRRGVRDTIARRMRESLASTAQYTMHASADASGLLALRAKLKASGRSDITINDLVTFCTVRALVESPDLNAEFVGGQIVRHLDVHLAFACDTPRGLLAPVIRDAHTLSLAELARRMKALATQAIAGTLSAESLTGATFTISNLGALGIESFTPLLNPPQVAILGVGAVQLKPVRKEGQVTFIDAIGLSLTCDHQVIDGAPGAMFLGIVRDKIETIEDVPLQKFRRP